MSITLRYGIAVAASVVIGTAIFLPTTPPRKQIKPQDIAYLWEAVAERKMVVPTRISAVYTNTIGTRTNVYTYQVSTTTTNTIVYSNIVWKADTSVTNRQWKSVAIPNIANTNEGTMEPFDAFDRWNCVSNVFISTGQYFVAWVPIKTPAARIFEPLRHTYTVSTTYGSYSGTYTFDDASTRTSLQWKSGDKTLTRVLENQAGTWNWDTWEYSQYPIDLAYTWILSAGGVTIQKSAASLDGGALAGPCRWQYGWDEVTDPVTVTGSGPLLNANPYTTCVGFNYTNIPNLITRINSGNSGDSAMSLYAIDMAIGQLIPNFIDTRVQTAGTYNAYFSTIRNSNLVTTLPLLTINKAFEMAGVGTTYVHTIYGTQLTNSWFTWPPANTNQYDGVPNLFVYGRLYPDVYRGGITTNALYERYKLLQILTQTQEALQSSNTYAVYTNTTKDRQGIISYFAGYGHEFAEKHSVMSVADYMTFMAYPPDADFDFTKDWISGADYDESHTSTIQYDEWIRRYQRTTLTQTTNGFTEVYASAYTMTLTAYDFSMHIGTFTIPDNPNSPYSDYGGGGENYYAVYNKYNVRSPRVWRAGIPAAKGVEADFDFYFRYGTASIGSGLNISMTSTSPCSRAASFTDTAEQDVVYVPTNTPLDYPDLKIHYTFTSSSSTQNWGDSTYIYTVKDWLGNYSTQANYSVSAMKGPVVSKWKFQYCAP
jgi:hypothetical protein